MATPKKKNANIKLNYKRNVLKYVTSIKSGKTFCNKCNLKIKDKENLKFFWKEKTCQECINKIKNANKIKKREENKKKEEENKKKEEEKKNNEKQT